VPAFVPLTSHGNNVVLALGRPRPVLVPRGLSPRSWHSGPLKRGFDLLLGVALLVVTAPVLLLTMALVKLTSRGPALYWQTRMGLGGRPFTIYKVRTMRDDCESLTGALWSPACDSRVTAVGRLLRQTHLDELPQLWNVLRGDMSLVGPRPERPEFVPQLEQAVRHYRARMLVRPGVTGLAQLQLPPDTDLDSVRHKLAYDLYYVQHAGFWLDLRLLAGTAFKVVGLPFTLLRRLVGLPRREAVEQTYASLPVESAASARVHAT
jgi:lipopolysaccharide/colanic/teichoic acid biosynthesis glycosyltransferase